MNSNNENNIVPIGTTTIKGIIFDLDGTLLDTESLSDRAMFAALQPFLPSSTKELYNTMEDYRLPWELKKRILGLRSSDWGPIVLSYVNSVWGIPLDALPTVEQLSSDWEHHLNEYCENVQVCVGAYELITQFANLGLPMAIATSSRQSAVQKKYKRHQIMFQRIPIIVCGDHPAVRQGKPAPDIYLEAARQLNIDPKHCLVFEDALTGMRSAKAAGCYVVAVPDSRFDDIEKDMFRTEAHIVVKDLGYFSGAPFGLNVDMPTVMTKT